MEHKTLLVASMTRWRRIRRRSRCWILPPRPVVLTPRRSAPTLLTAPSPTRNWTSARALAPQLLDWGVRPSDAVGLRVHRGVEQYVALYALLYAGATTMFRCFRSTRRACGRDDGGCRMCSLLLHGPGLHPLSAQELNPQEPAASCEPAPARAV